ncbi:MAG: hypothetical protein IVW57_07900, partial [Ktedonobacterales bacterium]|nr:hypothetical protein [Ktedonobacterales bacterium]
MSERHGSEPRDIGLALHIAEYHLGRRDTSAAEAALAALSDLDLAPSDGEALASAFAQLARTYVARRDVASAERALAQARRLAEPAAVWRAEAALAALRGDVAGGVVAWRRVAVEEPESAAVWLALARAHEAAGQPTEAVTAYLQAARVDGSSATILTVAERVTALDPVPAAAPVGRRVRIALLGSATLEHLRAYLVVHCRLAGLLPEIYVGPYGQYAQEIHHPTSGLYAFQPEIVVLAIHGRALFPDLYDA